METRHTFSIGYFLFVLALMMVLQYLIAPSIDQIPYSELKAKLAEGRIESVVLSDEMIQGEYRNEEAKTQNFSAVRVEDPDLIKELQKHGVKFSGRYESPFLSALMSWVLPALVFVGIWAFVMRRMNPGANVMAFGKSRAKIYAEKETGVTFKDVAGTDEAKDELKEIIQFLKTPEKFRALGGKLPKGVLLVGPPGTGKTLLARAVAGEAGVPFFSISGSEFVELFVGMGAARVRDMFAQAQAKAPCIVFIDELDAIGKARGIGGVMGGHDERENTLNQLLVEMDGFDTSVGVIILAATNRPEVLDPALLRAGRFDRHVLVDKPDLAGREAILRVHTRGVKLAPDVDLKLIARRTPGFVGADLANVVNEAALLAARHNKQQVERADFESAIDRVVAGLEKKNRLINQKEREIVAVHETGHALMAAFTESADKVHKISIIPRGIGALGYTQQLPTEDRYLMTRAELEGKIDVLFGGRAAEQIVFGEISTGASNDLDRATQIARSMVQEYGMGETLGPVTFPRRRRPLFLTGPEGPYPEGDREYSEATARALDEETKKILDGRMQHVLKVLKEKRPLLDKVPKLLLEKEVIEADEFHRIIEEHNAAKGKQNAA
jgi:cell division protease FtsH